MSKLKDIDRQIAYWAHRRAWRESDVKMINKAMHKCLKEREAIEEQTREEKKRVGGCISSIC